MRLGDTVRILNELGEGIIVRVINKSRVFVDFGDGMEIDMQTKDLVLINSSQPENPAEDQEPIQPAKEPEPPVDLSVLKNIDFSPRPQQKKRQIDIHAFANSLTPLEVDLHIQKLTDDYAGLSNGEMLFMQISHFESYMDLGMRGQYKSIIFIHGIGTGVLKKEIRNRLASYRSIRVSDGDTRKYGFGATQVSFEH